jgi:hypothetical protein
MVVFLKRYFMSFARLVDFFTKTKDRSAQLTSQKPMAGSATLKPRDWREVMVLYFPASSSEDPAVRRARVMKEFSFLNWEISLVANSDEDITKTLFYKLQDASTPQSAPLGAVAVVEKQPPTPLAPHGSSIAQAKPQALSYSPTAIYAPDSLKTSLPSIVSPSIPKDRSKEETESHNYFAKIKSAKTWVDIQKLVEDGLQLTQDPLGKSGVKDFKIWLILTALEAGNGLIDIKSSWEDFYNFCTSFLTCRDKWLSSLHEEYTFLTFLQKRKTLQIENGFCQKIASYIYVDNKECDGHTEQIGAMLGNIQKSQLKGCEALFSPHYPRNYVAEIEKSKNCTEMIEILNEGLQFQGNRALLDISQLRAFKWELLVTYSKKGSDLIRTGNLWKNLNDYCERLLFYRQNFSGTQLLPTEIDRLAQIEKNLYELAEAYLQKINSSMCVTYTSWRDFSAYCESFFAYRHMMLFSLKPSFQEKQRLESIEIEFCQIVRRYSTHFSLGLGHEDSMKAILDQIRKEKLAGYEGPEFNQQMVGTPPRPPSYEEAIGRPPSYEGPAVMKRAERVRSSWFASACAFFGGLFSPRASSADRAAALDHSVSRPVVK